MYFFRIIIETPRLRLLSISHEYQDVIFQGFTAKVARYLSVKPTNDITDTKVFIDTALQRMRRGEELQCAVVMRKTNEFIGCAGLHDVYVKPEIGLWIKESYWHQGFGTETVSALQDWAKRCISGHRCFYYSVHVENITSRRIAEKIGGRLVKPLFYKNNVHEQHHPILTYRI